MDNPKKPIYKRKWFIVLCVLVIIGAIGNMNNTSSVEPTTSQSKPNTDQTSTQTNKNDLPEPNDSQDVTNPQEENPSNTDPIADVTPTESENEPDAEPAESISTVTLGLSLEDFRTRLNQNLKSLDSEKSLDEITQQDGEISATGIISDLLAFSFAVSPDNEEITSIIFIGAGDNTPQSGVDIMFSMAASMMAVDPSIKKEESGQLILDLLDEEKGHALTRNGIQYTVIMSPELGTLLTIDPSK